jgi:hypothetical protein
MQLGGYEQVYGPMPPGDDYAYGWTCTCKGFYFRRRCKHVRHAETLHCGWEQMHHGGAPIDGRCPKCERPTITISYAV